MRRQRYYTEPTSLSREKDEINIQANNAVPSAINRQPTCRNSGRLKLPRLNVQLSDTEKDALNKKIIKRKKSSHDPTCCSKSLLFEKIMLRKKVMKPTLMQLWCGQNGTSKALQEWVRQNYISPEDRKENIIKL